MPGIGMSELLVILVIIVILFGATRLPQLGKGLGEGIKNFKNSIKSVHEDDNDETADATRKKSA